MRLTLSFALATLTVATLPAQVTHKFPPDSLLNTRVIPRATPPLQVIGTMRNFAGNLGVRCQYCHEGTEGQDLAEFDFASDAKRTKRTAREMMKMVAEVNRRLDSLPERQAPSVQVTCATCHRGVARPVPLSQIVADAAQSSGADSALRAYKALRERYYGGDAYNFTEPSLNTAAFRLARGGKIAEAIAILDFNEGMYPASTGLAVFRGNVLLMKGDTSAAAAAFHEALRRDPTNGEAQGRLRTIGRP